MMTVPVSFGIVVRTVILYGANMMNGLDKSKLISIIGIFGIFLVAGNSIAIGSVLFTDSFDSGVVSSEWKSRFPANLWIQDEWLHLKNNDGWWPRDAMAIVHDGDENWTNYQYAVTVESLPGEHEHFNILFRTDGFSRYSDGSSGNGYQLNFNGYASSVQLSRVVDGVNTALWQQPWNNTSDIVDILIDVSGDRIRAFTNNDILFDIVDPSPLLYGGIGMHTIWEAESRFDNVFVETIPLPATAWLFGSGLLGLIAWRRTKIQGHPLFGYRVRLHRGS
jgi:hypothetical protein